MKKILITLLSIFMILTALVSCDSKEVPDLKGEWKQINSNSEDSWQAATITEDTITINWVSDGGDTKSLYWVGSFTAPTTSEEYSWDSNNTIDENKINLLASQDEIKTFTYKNGIITYEVSAMGVTTKVELKKQ